MPGLPATGTLSYNGVEFTAAHHVNAEVMPVYEDTGRTVKAHRITISVQAIITSGDDSSTDSTLETLRFRLGQSGKELIFRNKGFGDDLLIGPNRRRKDIDNGPNPEVLSWTPVGNDLAAEITWRVSTTIPPCKYARFIGVSAINWGANWNIDNFGSTTRILSGHIEIAGTAVGRHTADSARNFFAPEILRGFSREQSWTLSADKRRIDFSITDSQISSPNAYPPGIPAIDCKHRTSWSMKDAGRPSSTISATITPDRGLTGAQAYQVFTVIVAQRMDWARRKGLKPFLTGLEIEEDLFGRPQSFRASYWFEASLQSIISNLAEDAGLWRPIGTDWTKWAVSLTGSQFNNRGNAGLGDIASDDAVVDLCSGERVIRPNNAQRIVYDGPPARPSMLTNKEPSPEKSYIEYKMELTLLEDNPAVLQPALQESGDPEVNSWEVAARDDPDIPANLMKQPAGAIPDRIEVGGLPSHGVRLTGRAVRAGHKIPVPKLTQVGNQKPVMVRKRFLQTRMGQFGGVPLFGAKWSIDYLLEESPGRVEPPGEKDPNFKGKYGRYFYDAGNPPPLITTR